MFFFHSSPLVPIVGADVGRLLWFASAKRKDDEVHSQMKSNTNGTALLRAWVLTGWLLAQWVTPALAFESVDGYHSAVLALGDVDGDGIPDFAAAHRPRPFASVPKARVEGEFADWPEVPKLNLIWILSGKDGRVLHTLSGGPGFGDQLISAGDLDGDGIQDLVSSDEVPRGTMQDWFDPGYRQATLECQSRILRFPDPSIGQRRVRVFSGATGEVIGAVRNKMELEGFGLGLSGGLDAVGDATPDLLIGSKGSVWLVDGATLNPVSVLLQLSEHEFKRFPIENWYTPAILPDLWPTRTHIKGSSSYIRSEFGQHVWLLPDREGDSFAEIAFAYAGLNTQAFEGYSPEHIPSGVTQIHSSSSADGVRVLPFMAWNLIGGPDLDGDDALDLVLALENDSILAVGQEGALWERSFRWGGMRGEGTSLLPISDFNQDGVVDFVHAANESSWDSDTGFLEFLSGVTGEALIRSEGMLNNQGTASGPLTNGGLDAAPIGDLNGDGLEEIVGYLPVKQELHVFDGKDLSTLWKIDVGSLPRPGKAER
jgi:hypothetical protein